MALIPDERSAVTGERKPAVAVALSGGLDSAAAAIVLQELGHPVTGLTMTLPLPDEDREALLDSARRVCEVIGIEHHIVDLGAEFERLVVGPFIESYKGGLTPNPCIACNRDIKFGLLLEEARRLGCSLLATGHYARVVRTGDSNPKVLKGKDRKKDQSYVMWTLDHDILHDVLFPLGESSRDEAQSLVTDRGLDHMLRPESQDICFLAGRPYHQLIAERAPGSVRPGPIVDLKGEVLGEHKGLPLYTVGQRKGLGLGTDHALYIVEIRPEDNTLVVGGEEQRYCTEFYLEHINLISGMAPDAEFRCEVTTRYRGPCNEADVSLTPDGRATVRYLEPGPPAAPGQSAVFYDGEELLGGGIIYRPSSALDTD